MKKITKILSMVMAVILAFGILIMPSSAETNSDEEVIVARMYVGHNERYMNLSGHTWIYIENLSDHTLTVGAYTLKKGKGVSVGTFGTTLEDGRGLYYNVEAWRYRNIPITDYIHLSKDLTQEDLDKVSKRILNGGAWSYFLNCAYFAFSVWNSVPGKPLVYLLYPTIHQLQILMYPGHGNGFKMTTPSLDEIFKQKGRGDRAELVPANPSVV
ncbi:MAG: hypothetical protein J6L62_03380 [Clostridia bacterium]|nr:hypothetical protein [Clostridia bacterium]